MKPGTFPEPSGKGGMPRKERPYLQPLAVGMVCAVFVALIVVMGVMDLRRSERTLEGFMENQGLRIIGVVERLARENLRTMIQASQRTGSGAFRPLSEQLPSPEVFLTEKVVAMARQIDRHWKKEHLSEGYIRRYARDNNLWLVAVLNAWGDVIYQSREIPEPPAGRRPTVRKEGTPELLFRLSRLDKVGFIALRRPDASGTIVIALDQQSVRYWGARVAVEKAIEKLGEGQGQGIVYLSVRDKKGRELGSLLAPPEPAKDDAALGQVLAGSVPFVSRTVRGEERAVFEIVAPLRLDEEIAGVVRVGLERGNTDQILAENRRNIYVFLALVVLITLLSMWLLYDDQNRHLAGLMAMERQLQKAERLSSLGQLAAGVAHEIRNPLNAISMASQRLKREFAPQDAPSRGEFEALSGVIRDEIRRLNAIIEEFLTFSKSRRLELRDCPLKEVLQKITTLLSAEAASRGISLKADLGQEEIVIPMDMDKLQQAFLNLMKNAMESMETEGTVTVSLQRPHPGWVSVRIADTGCGMTAAEVERIFNPEYTTKEKGLGLGLPLSHEIILGHGGRINVESAKGRGTTFEVLLPTERTENSKGARGE